MKRHTNSNRVAFYFLVFVASFGFLQIGYHCANRRHQVSFNDLQPSSAELSAELGAVTAVRPYATRTLVPTLFINLERSSWRRKYMEDVFGRNNNNFMRFPAVDKVVVGGYVSRSQSSGESALWASHMMAMMAGFNLQMSEIYDKNASKDLYMPEGWIYRMENMFDFLSVLEDDATDFPGMLYSSPWAIEKLANELEDKQGDSWRMTQLQLTFRSTVQEMYGDHLRAFRASRRARKGGYPLSENNNMSSLEISNQRRSLLFRTRLEVPAQGSVGNFYCRRGANSILSNWPKDSNGKWMCNNHRCISDRFIPDAFWSTPPLLNYRLSEGSTGVRSKHDSMLNDHRVLHYLTMQRTNMWVAMDHDAKSIPHSDQTDVFSPLANGEDDWSCEFKLKE